MSLLCQKASYCHWNNWSLGEWLKTGYLPNRSFSSCSETNCPKLATKRVEQGGVLQLEVEVVEPTGLAIAVLAATRCEGGMVP